MATLCILDDGRDDGEWVRIRGDKVVIGRNEGDICIPHDTMILAGMRRLPARQSRAVIAGS